MNEENTPKSTELNGEVGLGAIFFPTTDGRGGEVKFDELYIPYIYREIYFEGVYKDILNNQTEMTILDIGANIGITVQHFKDYAKKVYAVEPLLEHFAALKKNKEFNNWDNVEVFNVAISGSDGEVTMHRNPANRTCASYVLEYQGAAEKIKGVALDTFFEENKIEKIDFCKFDVEGAEDDILRSEGFKKVCDKIKAIEVEFHFPTWTSLVEYMQELGYTARRYESSAIIVLFTRP